MKRLALALVVITSIAVGRVDSAGTQELAPVTVGQLVSPHRVVLDGTTKTVALRIFKTDASGDEIASAAQLVVLDGRGKDAVVVFEGPRVTDLSTEPFRFVQGPAGFEAIDLVGDVDGDGSVELFSARMQSDVRPPTWRVYRWRAHRFEFVRAARLTARHGSPSFTWSTSPLGNIDSMPWVNRVVRATGAGQLEVEITECSARASKVARGKAILQAEGVRGYRTVRWLEPLKTLH